MKIFLFFDFAAQTAFGLPRLPLWRLLFYGFWMIFVLSLGALVQPIAAQATDDSGERALHRARLEHWLAVVGLSDAWEIEKLRWGPDPSPTATTHHEVLRLELRFSRGGGDQGVEDKEFLRSLESYQATYGDSAPERIFYQLIHECHVGLREAVVILRVVRTDYMVFFDPGIGDLSMQPRTDRSYSREVPFELPKIAAGSGLQASLGTLANPDRRAISALVDTFLHDYFKNANRQANMSEPRIDPDDVENRDHDHVGYVISGIRGQVLKDRQNWEKIEISLNVVQAPSGMKLLSHFDGYFAVGMGHHLPDDDAYEDMRKNFRDQLKGFADGFLLQLQHQSA